MPGSARYSQTGSSREVFGDSRREQGEEENGMGAEVGPKPHPDSGSGLNSPPARRG